MIKSLIDKCLTNCHYTATYFSTYKWSLYNNPKFISTATVILTLALIRYNNMSPRTGNIILSIFLTFLLGQKTVSHWKMMANVDLTTRSFFPFAYG